MVHLHIQAYMGSSALFAKPRKIKQGSPLNLTCDVLMAMGLDRRVRLWLVGAPSYDLILNAFTPFLTQLPDTPSVKLVGG